MKLNTAMRIATPSVLCVVLTALILAAGCSGSADSDDSAPETQPAAEEDAAGQTSGEATDQPDATAGTTLVYSVSGMHCDGCASAIQSRVAQIRGVSQCDASFENSSATVVVEDADVGKEILAAIREMGYTIEPAGGEGS